MVHFKNLKRGDRVLLPRLNNRPYRFLGFSISSNESPFNYFPPFCMEEAWGKDVSMVSFFELPKLLAIPKKTTACFIEERFFETPDAMVGDFLFKYCVGDLVYLTLKRLRRKAPLTIPDPKFKYRLRVASDPEPQETDPNLAYDIFVSPARSIPASPQEPPNWAMNAAISSTGAFYTSRYNSAVDPQEAPEPEIDL